MAKNGAMVAYQGEVSFEHKGGGLGRLLKKAATGESLRLMQATGSGELFLAYQAMLVHVLRLEQESITVNGENILAFETGIEWDVTRVKGGTAGVLAGGLFNIHLSGSGLVALVSDGEPVKLDIGGAPTFCRSAGRDRLVGRRQHDTQDRGPGQDADRDGLRRELPARIPRPGLGARAALRGQAGPGQQLERSGEGPSRSSGSSGRSAPASPRRARRRPRTPARSRSRRGRRGSASALTPSGR
jgi:Mitochondrial biogenesis AIM24